LGGDSLKEVFKMTCIVFLIVIIICIVGIMLVLGFSFLLSLFLPQLIALVGGFVLCMFTFTFGMILFDQKYEENK
jgi:hypothetical protein